MSDDKEKEFTYQRGDGQRSYKVTWDSGKKTYTYTQRDGRSGDHSEKHAPAERQLSERKAPQPPAKKQIKKPSVIPLICVAAMWIGKAFTGGLNSLGGIIKCAVLSAVALGVLRLFFPDKLVDAPEKKLEEKPRPKLEAESEPVQPKPAQAKPAESAPASTGNAELDEVLRQGEASIAEIRRLNDAIPDFKISAQLKQLEILTGRIFDFVRQHPEDVRQIRQFLNFYLPTTIKLLQQYVVLQNQGMRMGNIDEGMQKIEDMLDKVILAFQKQLDSLFESDVVDITADIQVMEQMMAAEGLTGEKLPVDR